MELWRYFRILRRYRWAILACVLVCASSVFIYLQKFTHDEFIGRTRVMERQPSTMGVSVYNTPLYAQFNENHLYDLSNIAISETVNKRALDALSAAGLVVDPVEFLKSRMVTQVPNSQMLSIEVTSNDSKIAMDASAIFAKEFQKYYRELMSSATEESRDFISKQLKDSKKKLAEVRDARMRFKEENGFVILDAESKVLIERVSQMESEAIQAQIAENEFRNRLASVEKELKAEPEMKMASESTVNNPIYQSLLDKRIAAETELASMEWRGKNHPDVIALRKTIDETNAELRQQMPMIVNQQVSAQNQVYTGLLQSHLSVNVEASAATAKRQALLSAIATERAKLNVLPETETKMAQLEMDVKSAEDTYALLSAKFDEARIRANESDKTASILILDTTYEPVSAKKALKLALSVVLSLFLGIGLAFFLAYMDNTIRTPDQAHSVLGIPIASVVPFGARHSLVKRPDNAPLLATYEMLTASLWNKVAGAGSSVVLVAGAEPKSGRTVTAGNLAVTLAKEGARVILVDADMRHSQMHQLFGVNSKPGLSNVLSGAVSIEDALFPTKIEGLLVMPAGPLPDNPMRLLRSEQLASFVDEIGSLADFVIVDTPAGAAFADAMMIANHVKNVVFAYSAGSTSTGGELEFINKLNSVGANIIGAVVNKVRTEDYAGYVKYHRAYGAGKQDKGRVSMMVEKESSKLNKN